MNCEPKHFSLRTNVVLALLFSPTWESLDKLNCEYTDINREGVDLDYCRDILGKVSSKNILLS